MAEFIDKDALVAEIKKRIKYYQAKNQKWGVAGYAGRVAEGEEILSYINTLEVKDMDLEKVYKEFVVEYPVYNKLINGIVCKAIAKHFFELGISINHPITASDKGMAEEIILNLEKIEKDYNLCLIKEKEWVNKQVQKGE